MKKIAILIILIVLNSLVVSAELNDNELNEIKNKINEKKHLVPSGLKKIFNEMNAVVVIEGIEYTAISKDGELLQLVKGRSENPTMEILISETTIRDIINNRIIFSDALKNGKVIYRPISKKSKIIYGIARLGGVINKIFGG